MITVIVVLSRPLSNYCSLPSLNQLLFYVVPQALIAVVVVSVLSLKNVSLGKACLENCLWTSQDCGAFPVMSHDIPAILWAQSCFSIRWTKSASDVNRIALLSHGHHEIAVPFQWCHMIVPAILWAQSCYSIRWTKSASDIKIALRTRHTHVLNP